MSEGGEPSAPATPVLLLLSYTTPWDAATISPPFQEAYSTMKPISELLNNLRRLDVKLWVNGNTIRYNAPKEISTPALLNQLRERKAEILAFLHNSHLPPILPVNRDRNLPLSFGQQRLWFLEQLEPNRSTYCIATVYRLTGSLNVTALEQSLHELIQRHEILRTTFPAVDGLPVQVISQERALTMPLINLEELLPNQREAEAQRQAKQEAQRAFNLAQGPLFRAKLLRLTAQEHVLLLNMHHIISDGWSFDVSFRELTVLYKALASNKPSPLPKLPIQYADFAFWQREWIQGEFLQSQLDYWRQQLSQELSVLQLPTDRPRPPVKTYQGSHQSLELSNGLTQSLKALSQREGVTLFMTLLAAFQTLLFRYCGQSDIIIGSPIAGRNQAETNGLIGFFVNTLVLRTDHSGNPSFRELLYRVREVALGAYAHQDLPFEQLLEELQPERDLSRTPLFDVMFILQKALPQVLELPGLSLMPLQVDNGTAKFDLTLELQEIAEGIRGRFEYNTDLFDAATISRMSSHFQTLLESIVDDPHQLLYSLPLMTTTAQHQLLVEWNDTKTEYPKDKCIHQLFEDQVERTPEAIALVFEEQSLSYTELNIRANRLAHHLMAQGVRPDDRVALLMERSPALVVAILAILKAGSAYVPLHNEQPSARHARIMADAGVRLLLIDGTAEAIAAEPLLVLSLDAIEAEGLPEHDPGLPVFSQQLAYVMFTSGSTGVPKGVAVTHSNIVSLAADSCWRNGTHERVLFHSPHAFDASTYELWVPLLHGGQVVVAPPVRLEVSSLADLIERHSVSGIFLTTALFNLLAEMQPTCLGSVGEVWTGGEAVSPLAMERVRLACPRTRIVHVYGPTETTTFACFYKVPPTERLEGTVPIGKPMEGMRAYVLDAGLQPSPVGVPGELYLAGTGLAQGYLGLPGLTSERFVADPFAALFADGGARMYRTGDLARWLPDGNLEYIGRVDFQVKIRGFRIEPGEIETALRGCDGIREAVVLAREDAPGEKRLVAYVTADLAANTADNTALPAVLKAHLQSNLPGYMVPAAFVVLDSLPLTRNGKLDRKALPAPFLSPSSTTPQIQPSTSLQQDLLSLWQEVLGRSDFGISDNFFELGGHSLMAVRLLARIEQNLNQKVPLSTIFHAPTVDKMSQFLCSTNHHSLFNSLVPIQPEGHQPPIFAIHGLGKGLEFYRPLAKELGHDYPLWGLSYGLAAPASQHGIAIPTSIPELATHYIEEMRTLQPQGPYTLLGFSASGLVAYEMAKQLEQKGHANTRLVLIDTSHPISWKSQTKVKAKRSLIRRACYQFSILLVDLHMLEMRERWPWAKKRLGYYIAKIYAIIAPGSMLKKQHTEELDSYHSQPSCFRLKFYANYSPLGFQGRIILFKARYANWSILTMDKDRQSDTLGWETVSSRGVETFAINGDHVTLLTGLGSRVIAKHLITILDRRP